MKYKKEKNTDRHVRITTLKRVHVNIVAVEN